MQRSRRSRRTALLATFISIFLCLPAGVAAPAFAQDAEPSGDPLDIDLVEEGEPSALCSILTAEEASAAFGVTLTVGSSSETDCSWDSDFQTSDISLLAARDVGDLELDAQEIFPDGTALEVAGRNAWYTEEGLALFVDAGGGLLFTIELFGTPPDGLDLEAALTALAEIAVPRLAEIPGPTEEPQPSYEGDPVLQALIPTQVGDAPVGVDVYSGNDLVADTDPDDPEAQASLAELRTVLGAHGASIDDVSFANGYFATETAYGDLFAIRVADADMAALRDDLVALVIELEDPYRQPATIGGKEVIVITDGPPVTGSPDPSADPFDLPLPPSYVYVTGDVLFIVSAEEPQLSELIGQLP